MFGKDDGTDGAGGTTPGYRDTQLVDGPAREVPPLPTPRSVPEGVVPLPPAESVPLSVICTVERHLDEILASVPQPDPIELAVLDAQGLLCAEEVISQRALPAFDQAALDGYAVRAEDVAGARPNAPVSLAVVGESVAGAGVPSSIGPGLAFRVSAGAMLPTGADVVVPGVWTDQGAVRVEVLA
ncbi:MAG: molybdopterin molybdenumtransferase, partial [Blastococcus sp.]|nr:molybdopterin molybdenumtransferase [Blastococcus sp.]